MFLSSKAIKRLCYVLGVVCLLTLLLKGFLSFYPLSLKPYLSQVTKRLPKGTQVTVDGLYLTWQQWLRPFEVQARQLHVTYAGSDEVYTFKANTCGVLFSLWKIARGHFEPASVYIKDFSYTKVTKKAPQKRSVKENPLKSAMGFLGLMPQMTITIDNRSSVNSLWLKLWREQDHLRFRVSHLYGDFALTCKLPSKDDMVFSGEGHATLHFIALRNFVKDLDALKVKSFFRLAYNKEKGGFEGALSLNSAHQGSPFDFVADVALDEKHAVIKKLVLSDKVLSATATGGLVFSDSMPLDVSLQIKPITLAQLMQRWPAQLALTARTWVKENLSGGRVGARLFIKRSLLDKKAPPLTGELDIKDTKVRLFEGVFFVNNVSAKGTFDDTSLTFNVEKGTLQNQQLTKGHIAITGLDNDKEFFELKADFKGDIPDMLNILSKKPLEYTQKIPVPVDSLKGNIATHLHLTFPLLQEIPKERVHVGAEALLDTVRYVYQWPGEAQTYPVSNGSFKLNVGNKSLLLEGTGDVLEQSLTLFLEEYFDDQSKSFLKIKGRLTPAFLERFGLGVVSRVVPSPFEGAVTYHLDGRSTLHVDADFQEALLDGGGLLKKPKKVPATLALDVDLKQKKLSEIVFRTPFLDMRGDAMFDDKWHPAKASFMGKTPKLQDFLLTFAYTDNTYRIDLSGKRAHVKNLVHNLLASDNSKSKESTALSNGQRVSVSANLKEAVIEPGYPLCDVSLTYQGAQKGKTFVTESLVVRGKGPVKGKQKKSSSFSVRKKPAPKELSAFEIKTTNAGYLLAAMGWLSNVKDGSLLVNLDEKSPTSGFEGLLVAKDFAIQKTTFTQRFFITLTSPTSFLRLFSKGDMSVADLRVRFVLKDGVLTMKRANASCIDTAFAWKGWIDFNQDVIDVAGNVIPAYFLNRLITSIPILGRLIAGSKDDGLFATRFYVKGPLKDPKVSANPLQIITPGFLKEQFQEEEEKKIDKERPRT